MLVRDTVEWNLADDLVYHALTSGWDKGSRRLVCQFGTIVINEDGKIATDISVGVTHPRGIHDWVVKMSERPPVWNGLDWATAPGSRPGIVKVEICPYDNTFRLALVLELHEKHLEVREVEPEVSIKWYNTPTARSLPFDKEKFLAYLVALYPCVLAELTLVASFEEKENDHVD